MIFSVQQLFSDHQAITGNAASTNHIDLGDTGTPHRGNQLDRDIGKGQPIPIECIVTEAFDALTTLEVAVEVDDNDSFSSAKVVDSHTFSLAELVGGANLPFRFIPDGTDERYLRLNYTVVGSNPTVGKLYAGISMGRQTNR
jgi:hypothetical protein